MSTQVDDLQIKISAEADKANKAIDILISKLGTLEERISVFGKIKDFDAVKSSAAKVSTTVSKEMSKAAESVSRYTAKTVNKSAEQIETLKKSYSGLGKNFEKNGGFANLKTPRAFEKAIDDYKVKIARAFENAAKADTQKGFNSAIKSAIQYTNILDSLKAKLEEVNVAESVVPRTWAEEKAAIEKIRNSVQSLSKEELEAATSLDKVRIRGVNDSNLSEIEARISRINDNLRGVDTGRFADYDAMAKALKEDLSYLQEMQSYIEQNMPQYEKMIDNVATAIEKVNSDIEEVLSKTGGGSKEAEKIQLGFYSATKEISGFVKILESMNIVKPRESFISLQKDIEKTEAKLEKLYTQMERGLNGSGNDFKRTSTYNALSADIKATEDHLKSLARQMDGMKTHEIDWGSIGTKMRESFGSAVGVVKNLTTHVFNLANSLNKKIVGGFANLAKNLNKTDDVAKKLFKSFTKVGNMLKLMITRMALRAVINEARTSFGELLQFSDKTAASFNKIRNAIKYLADTLVTLTAPILNASGTFRGLGNIIDAVSDKIVDLINKFNQLLSALLGHSTWIKATKQTKDYTKEVDKAGKAAKKALQPFDELNNLTSNDSGGGGDSGTGGSQFQELPIDPKWAKIADWLKDMWKKADFTALGALLGQKLRDALNSIPWGKIQNTARRLASSIATLLNGFFTTPGLAKSIGNTIAQAINTGLIFAEEFIKKFDFGAFGKFIGDAIVTAIKNIHWQRFVDACGNLGKGIATAINSLVNTGVISQIGKAIGKILLAAINFAFNLITNIDFDKLAEEIANGIKNFLGVLGDVDKDTGLSGWEKIGKTLSDGLLGILKILNKTLGDKDIREKISKGITDMLNQIKFSEIIGQSAELIKNIALGFANVIIAAFKSEEFRKGILTAIPYLAGAFALSLAGKGLASAGSAIAKNLLHYIGLSLANGTLFSSIGNAFMKLGETIFGKVGEGVVMASGKIGSAITTAMSGIGGTVLVACTTLVSGIIAFFAGADIGNTIGKYLYPDDKELYEKYDGIKGTINLTLEAIVTFYERAYERISGWISKWVEYQKTSVTNATTFVKEKFSEAKEFVVGKVTEIGTSIITKLTEMINKVREFINNVITTVKNGGQSIYTAITGVFTSIGQFFATLPQKAMTWGSNFMSGLIEGMKQKFSAFSNIASAAANAIRQNANGGILINGEWKPIQGYASGGVPKSAEMFLARENGAPELVGKMGSHTAVANNDQIVASVSDGVYRAVVAAMANQGGNTNVNVELVGDVAKLFKLIRQEGNEYQRRTGNLVWA